jgi:hypothetical protein
LELAEADTDVTTLYTYRRVVCEATISVNNVTQERDKRGLFKDFKDFPFFEAITS